MSTDLLEQFLNYIAVEKGLRPKSIEAYRRDLLDWIAFVEERGRNVTSSALDSVLSLFMVSLHDRGMSPRSMARKSSSLKGFYKFLLKEGYISEDPTGFLERPKIGKALPKVLSIQEVERILAQPDISTVLGLRDKAILEILYATGIRESELIDLTIGNLNATAEFLTVTGKGGRERIVPVGTYAIQAVNDYLKKGRNKLCKDVSERTLFLNPYGRKMSRMGIWKIVKKYSLMAAIGRPVSPHVFRHSCATHMLEGGASIVAVQEMLGHVDISTTQIYTHLTGKDLKNIHRQAHPRGK
ncbi:MAG: site-specific tyrosine recombinase XerD [Candidatus Rifleibacteriota bacterium]